MPRTNQRRKIEIATDAINALFNDVSVTQQKTREDLLTLRELIDDLVESLPNGTQHPSAGRVVK